MNWMKPNSKISTPINRLNRTHRRCSALAIQLLGLEPLACVADMNDPFCGCGVSPQYGGCGVSPQYHATTVARRPSHILNGINCGLPIVCPSWMWLPAAMFSRLSVAETNRKCNATVESRHDIKSEFSMPPHGHLTTCLLYTSPSPRDRG